MGIFDIFSSKKKGPEVKDLVWISQTERFKACIRLQQENPGAVVVCWFPETEREFRKFASDNGAHIKEVKLAGSVSSYMVTGKPVIFLEHHPLKSKEDRLMKDWNAGKIFVLNSLDEPLFLHFGGEKIVGLVQKMGLKEDEAIEHSLITKSIVNAQQKLEEKVRIEITADSAAEWFRRNKV